AQQRLQALKADFEYLLAGGMSLITVEDLDMLYESYNAIIDESNESWQSLKNEEATQPIL
ncbi:MAG: hypothetical protein ACWGQW_22540, partial [bacterium]